ncbi:phytanoyl- dioxygenase family protein [Colletotrichum plurivorum]|uniref:Phytanoyl- dioxygenase family protein n=1 Tax=Colletotrichum plurivorum TaxID=2175906 RepID=A0A8H6NFJ1_9PEZI|nr:phytanoyl- dioxygenase family protein [Colletotrichum plurivorum]
MAPFTPASPFQELIDHVDEHGYVIIQNAFTEAEIEEAHRELVRLAADAASAGPAGGDRAGRNYFEGLNTKRIYALLNKSPVFQKFPIQPTLLALNEHFLEPGFLLNSFHSVYIQPGEAPQMLHHDDGFVTVPRPHRPFGTVRPPLIPRCTRGQLELSSAKGVMVAIDDFTPANGATVVIPGSHRWGDKDTDRAPRREDAIPVVMSRGSAVFFVGTLWHGGGQNTTDRERRSMTVQYCQPWIRPLENQVLAVDWEKLEGMPRRLVDMLGYGVGAPFIGYADGIHPWKVVQRRLREQRERTRGGRPQGRL